MVAVLREEVDLQEPECLEEFHRPVLSAALVGLAYHHPSACLARLLEEAEPPPLLLELHAAAEELVEVVSQLRDAALVYPEQLLHLEHRRPLAPFFTRKRFECPQQVWRHRSAQLELLQLPRTGRAAV